MELGRDEARLPFHELGIILPHVNERLFIADIQRTQVHEHDRRGINAELALNGELIV